jgi:ABC-type glycerol-3-phosphate transport system substrate-binding protein
MAAVFFSIALSGCGSTTTNTNPNAKKVRVWSFEDPSAWKSITQRFESKASGYTLVYTQQTLDAGYENRVLNSILSGAGPDVWSMPNDWVYRHKDKLTPMPDATAKTFNIDQFVPSIKESVQFDNKIYALSPSSQPLMIYYNPKLFSQTSDNLYQSFPNPTEAQRAIIKKDSDLLSSPPQTWSDFVDAANLLTTKSGNNVQISGAALGTAGSSNSTDLLYLLMLQNETQILSSDNTMSTFNLPDQTATGQANTPGKRALDFYTSFANPASANYTWNDSLGNDVDAFGNGKAAMIFGYSDLQNTLLQKYPNLQYRKAFMPQLSSDSAKFVDFAKFNAFGVSNWATNPTVSWQLVSMLSIDLADSYNSSDQLYTSQKSTNYDISMTNRVSNNPEKLELATAKSLVKGRFPIDFDNLIKDAISNVNKGILPSQAALDLAASKTTDLLRLKTW